MKERARALIDTKATLNNLARVRTFAPYSKILAMVKSNAYGHGLITMAKILSGADGFGVACLNEGIELRESGLTHTIVLLPGVFSLQSLKLAKQYALDIVIHDFYQIKLLQSCDLPMSIWLKLDTGMHRLGFSPKKFMQAYEELANCRNVKKPIHLMTHLACADNLEKDTTLNQIELFEATIGLLDCPTSIANSAGIISWPQAITKWNRPGIMLYGISPMLGKIGQNHGLQPVMTLTSRIIAMHDLDKGEAIGYGGTWICPYSMRIAVVAIGYGDGYPRHAENGTPILIRNKLCSLVGRVSMDLITVDVSQCKEASIGDEVILWGNGLPAEIVAKYANTIAYELVCNVNKRVEFIYS